MKKWFQRNRGHKHASLYDFRFHLQPISSLGVIMLERSIKGFNLVCTFFLYDEEKHASSTKYSKI